MVIMIITSSLHNKTDELSQPKTGVSAQDRSHNYQEMTWFNSIHKCLILFIISFEEFNPFSKGPPDLTSLNPLPGWLGLLESSILFLNRIKWTLPFSVMHILKHECHLVYISSRDERRIILDVLWYSISAVSWVPAHFIIN